LAASNLELLAHHEAGHAALAHFLGLKLHAVWIDAAKDSGATEVVESEETITPLQHALILLAGGRAEKKLDPNCLERRLSTALDETRLASLISVRLERKLLHRSVEHVDTLGERIDGRLAACCARLIHQHWVAIQRVADVLMTEHRLSGSAAEALLSNE
jgi:hypothetical protein